MKGKKKETESTTSGKQMLTSKYLNIYTYLNIEVKSFSKRETYTAYFGVKSPTFLYSQNDWGGGEISEETISMNILPIKFSESPLIFQGKRKGISRESQVSRVLPGRRYFVIISIVASMPVIARRKESLERKRECRSPTSLILLCQCNETNTRLR